jgi:hypothetical protein
MTEIDKVLLEMRLADWKMFRLMSHVVWIIPLEILALDYWWPLP